LSNCDGAVFTLRARGAAGFGPATIVFLRGPPGDFPASGKAGLAARLRATGL